MDILITILILLGMVTLLIREIYDPLKIFVIVVALFLLCGFISIDEAVTGFSNRGVLSVAALFIIAGTVEKSSMFQSLTQFRTLTKKQFKPYTLFTLIVGCSAFLSNTPIVSLFIPIVNKISNKTGISASKLLIPLSYLSLLGGVLTLVGTSTNLVISGMMEDMGLEPLGFFEITKVALPSVLIGMIYIILFHNKRLPDRAKKLKDSMRNSNEHFVRFVVGENSSIVGMSIAEAKLRALSGVYLVTIERNDQKLFPVTPELVIYENDLLIFAGQTDQIDELKSIDNLVLETDHQYKTNYFNHDNTVILEAVITQPLGKPSLTIKELKFRKKYNAVIIGVIRNGERLIGKLGSIQPKLGDIFLMIAEKGSTGLIERDPSLTVINSEERKVHDQSLKSLYPVLAFVGTILFAVMFGLNILHTAIIGIAFLLLTNTIQIKEALAMVEYKTIILIATSFAIGKALMNTGTASYIASVLEPLIMNMHPVPLMMIVFVITNLFTTVITNNAAAILAIPIVTEVISVTSYELRPFLLVTAIAASASFLSPYGYQTNTMVYGAGGYKYRDFIIFGYPLTIILLLTSTLTTYVVFFR